MSENRIAKLREQKGWNQADLAKAMHVSQPTVANWENGKRDPDLNSLFGLSKFLNQSIDYIMCNKAYDKYGEEWHDLTYVEVNCKQGNYICEHNAHAVVVLRALQRMDIEKRNRLLNICYAAFPEEFHDLMNVYDYKPLPEDE